MESYEKCGQRWSYCLLCTLDTIHRLFFVTRLIINKVQWVNFKFENVIVSLHSLKTMGLGHFGGSIILRNGELLEHSPMRKIAYSPIEIRFCRFHLNGVFDI